jgi:Glyoxalase/Bleomycin resistance protein/Dioxygenase superfamily
MIGHEPVNAVGGFAFYHIGFAVPDIEDAMQTLTRTAGVGWNAPRKATLGPWTYTIVFTTRQPFIELIHGPGGSPWDTTETGARFDHLGWWTDSLDATAEHWSRGCGLQPDYDGRPEGRRFAYFTAEALGTRLELVDASRMGDFMSTWAATGAANTMDIIRSGSSTEE